MSVVWSDPEVVSKSQRALVLFAHAGFGLYMFISLFGRWEFIVTLDYDIALVRRKRSFNVGVLRLEASFFCASEVRELADWITNMPTLALEPSAAWLWVCQQYIHVRLAVCEGLRAFRLQQAPDLESGCCLRWELGYGSQGYYSSSW
ncbi:hypothetical protein BKA62DRAFT_675749 [Auriculariales sp. MPI-PUGE-AT-0066]|nr:hypothetical protein BKA62DRAFT_675749 [Auriculariales sp. MPI-PUGE-AT-0066]